MNRSTEPSRREVWRMFDRIAHRYDLLNHLLSGNRDKTWRARLARHLPDGANLTVLDLATGTADQLMALYESGKVVHGTGVDLAERMLDIGREKIAARGLGEKLQLVVGNAERIPFPDGLFDAVSITFGIRNVTDVPAALREMRRVLKPGGRALILEFSLPRVFIVRWFYLLYLRYILPLLGAVISGDRQAYRYLNRTVETFPSGKAFCQLMKSAGFAQVQAESLTLGVASIYQGDRA